MRRLLLSGAALLAVPALALAGATATDNGDTLRIKTKISPAKASNEEGSARSVGVKFDYWAATEDDSRLPDLRSVSVYWGGVVFNFDAFPKCDESEAFEKGDGACPPGSLVASGKAVAEVHDPNSPTAKSDVPVDVKVYNGILDTTRDGEQSKKLRDGLLFYTEVAGANITLPFWAEDKNRRVTYYNPEEDPAPPADNALYSIKEVHLAFPRRSTRKGGKRVPFMQAPKRCRKSWKTSATNDRYEGGELTAKHKVRCKKAG